jgi:hypothetical protein
MPGKSLHLFCLIAALLCPAFSWPAERKTEAAFPFPVEVDKAKGKTEGKKRERKGVRLDYS